MAGLNGPQMVLPQGVKGGEIALAGRLKGRRQVIEELEALGPRGFDGGKCVAEAMRGERPQCAVLLVEKNFLAELAGQELVGAADGFRHGRLLLQTSRDLVERLLRLNDAP